MRDTEVLLQFQRLGRIVKVTAIDPATLTEVSIQGPATLSEDSLRRNALAKLRYVLGRKAGAGPARSA